MLSLVKRKRFQGSDLASDLVGDLVGDLAGRVALARVHIPKDQLEK